MRDGSALTSRLQPLLAFVLLLALGGCDTLDRDQARICRLAAVALAPDTRIPLVVGSQRERPVESVAPPDEMPFAASRGAVEIDATSGDKPATVACAFGATAETGRRVAAVRTTSGLLSLPRLVALQRFWLDSADAVGADPAPISGAAGALALPAGTGYAAQQVVSALPSASGYALLAVAYALIYGLIGRVNLAFGAFAAVGGTAALIAVLGLGSAGVTLALLAALLAALLPTAAHGIVSARLVFQPLRRATGQQTLVATIGLALVLGEYLRLVQGPESHWIGPMLDTPMAVARDGSFVVTVTPVALITGALALAAGGGLALAMRYSSFGRNWRAFRDDAGAAALFGVGPDRLLAQSFALAAAFAGLAGGITVVIFGEISFGYAQVLGLKALTAAVLGGIGSIEGAFLGGLFIGVVETVWSSAFPVIHRDLVTFAILVAALIWRPGGFFGEAELVTRRV